jgi:hypothetical protein
MTALPSRAPAGEAQPAALALLDRNGGSVSLGDLENQSRFAVMDYGRKKTAVVRPHAMRAAFQDWKIEKTLVVAIQ